MITDLVKVLEIIANGIHRKHTPEEIFHQISSEKHTVDHNVIAAAYSWIYEKLLKDFTSNCSYNRSGSLRFFSSEETNLLGMVNANYLLHFYNIGLLNEKDLDKIIEQISRFPHGTVSLNDFNVLILALFLDVDKITPAGSRKMLYSSDKIN